MERMRMMMMTCFYLPAYLIIYQMNFAWLVGGRRAHVWDSCAGGLADGNYHAIVTQLLSDGHYLSALLHSAAVSGCVEVEEQFH